ncbi:hypothetical protein J7K52_03920 [Candidatus Bathyarchaeota archaeon]|nr:hypothetical protein [Candidatus Bathyarchaeota archaeon]
MREEELVKLSRENLEWFKENYDELKKKYDGYWIIIQNKKVVDVGRTFEEVKRLIKKYDPNTAVVEYIESKPIAMFFTVYGEGH